MKNPPMARTRALVALLALASSSAAVRADLTIGVSLPLTGPASSLGIPMNNTVKLWPAQIAGEKVKITVLDDATDPSKGVQNAQRFIEQNVDLVVGSVVTPVAAAMAQPLGEAQVPQFALGPFVTAPGKDAWAFRMVHGADLMARTVVEHMKKSGLRTVAFLGYSDAYGEGWLTELNRQLALPGAPKLGAVERFARTDASVNAQVLKVVTSNPDAVLVVASGGGAAMPQRALVERGFKGRVYQTHAAASFDFLRLAGKDAEGVLIVAAPSMVAEKLPAGHPSKALASEFVQTYEGVHGAGSRAIYSASTWDVLPVLQAALPKALKVAKPGTPAFRTALRDAVESLGPQPLANGQLAFTKDSHWAYGPGSAMMLRVVAGEWKID